MESDDERPEGQESPSFLQDVGKGVVREAGHAFGTSLRWAAWGGAIGAAALGAAGFWYFGTTGLAIGAAIGAVVGGVGSWLFYWHATSGF